MICHSSKFLLATSLYNELNNLNLNCINFILEQYICFCRIIFRTEPEHQIDLNLTVTVLCGISCANSRFFAWLPIHYIVGNKLY